MICIVVFVYFATNSLSPLLTFVIFSSIIVVFLSNYGKCCTHRVLYPGHAHNVPGPIVINPVNGPEGVWPMVALPYASYSTFRQPNSVAPAAAAAQTVYIVEQDGLVKQTIITTHAVTPTASTLLTPSTSMPEPPTMSGYPNAPAYTPN